MTRCRGKSASGGSAALKITVVLVDLDLLEMSGYDTSRRLSQHPQI
jgi:CheY-like chemotaxis protein